ncbi:uncharacterized protein BDFB_001423 [Asbolus verrucosus]|uniref:DUF4774 domain-containing protein n=1 Tax=Asbolus verrucosus TaxID=1661398 RepID=A0A482VY96_ASBVE|nr:uncharacterized protein BDFB_001423 [Asbolus verrucosus]
MSFVPSNHLKNKTISEFLSSLADTQPKVTIIPFYGGGKGQSLQIIEKTDGTVITAIIRTPESKPSTSEEAINAAELENPPLPSKQDINFGPNIRNIHKTALNIIKLQETAKQNGKLNPDEEAVYQQNMDALNMSAKNLAQLQDPSDKFTFENREGLTEWFERKKANKKNDKDKKKTEEEEKKKEEEKRKEELNKENEKPKEEEEKEENEDNEGISIGLPPENASVAEAKPVGLAVAGEGGVAASKPIATAVVGPGGLAIARPVGTAIAGVAPDQALVPIYAEGYVGGTKPKRYGTSQKPDAAKMLLHLALVVAVAASARSLPPREAPQPPKAAEAKQLLYVPERQQYSPELQYDLSLLEPQFQIPAYSFIGDKQPFPRVQPQIVLYHGGAAPGQPFLLQPGSPPGNFLVPQPGPNVILRDSPQRPVFVAGYPKPAHIPPIEKDAEEVPTNPSKIPPLSAKGGSRPEKLETFNEGDSSKRQATEAEVLAAADRNPAFNTRTNLRPGQRFFILNGQPLFSNYPYNNQLYPPVNLKYTQPAPAFVPQPKNISPYQNLLINNEPLNIPTQRANFQQSYPENLVLLNQPGGFQDDFLFRSPLPLNLAQTKDANDKPQPREEFNGGGSFGLLQLQETSEQDNEAVVVDAKGQQDESNNAETDSEGKIKWSLLLRNHQNRRFLKPSLVPSHLLVLEELRQLPLEGPLSWERKESPSPVLKPQQKLKSNCYDDIL